MIKTEKCNIIELLKNPQDTKYHFYHGGGNIENRRTIVEALVCNFDLPAINEHNHGLKEKVKVEQMELDLTG